MHILSNKKNICIPRRESNDYSWLNVYIESGIVVTYKKVRLERKEKQAKKWHDVSSMFYHTPDEPSLFSLFSMSFKVHKTYFCMIFTTQRKHKSINIKKGFELGLLAMYTSQLEVGY